MLFKEIKKKWKQQGVKITYRKFGNAIVVLIRYKQLYQEFDAPNDNTENYIEERCKAIMYEPPLKEEAHSDKM